MEAGNDGAETGEAQVVGGPCAVAGADAITGLGLGLEVGDNGEWSEDWGQGGG